MSDKFAIITSEGGTACAYSAGALLALLENWPELRPQLLIGVSGSASTLPYYANRQLAPFRKIWTDLISNRKFISKLRPHKIMDIHFLIDGILKNDPFDQAKLSTNDCQVLVCATNTFTGQADYFSSHQTPDFYEALRASAAIPILFNRRVQLNGQKYIDGAFAGSLIDNLAKAKELGATKILVINNASSNKWTTNFFMWLYGWFFSKNLRQTINNYYKKYTRGYKLNPETDVFILQAKNIPLRHNFDNNKKRLEQTFAQGYHDVTDNLELTNFLNLIVGAKEAQ